MSYSPTIGTCPLCGASKTPLSTVCRECYRGIVLREGRTDTHKLRELISAALATKGKQ